MLPVVCVCCASRCLQEPYDFHAALEDHGQNDNFIAELCSFMLHIERPLDIDISDKQLEVGASSLKVCARKPSFAAAIERITCSPACHHVSRVSPGHPTLMGTFMPHVLPISRACRPT